jgi:general secretion pathway protein K
MTTRGSDERGFALIAVLLVLALVGVIGAEFAFSMRLEAAAVRGYKQVTLASHLAEAAVAQAIREIVADYTYVGLDDRGVLTFYRADQTALPQLPRERVALGSGHFTYRLADEEARIDVNTAPPERLDRLLLALGLEKAERDTIVSSIQDWRDANDEHRLNGAESDDTYLRLPVPYRARNGNLESTRELLQIKGVTPALFAGADGRAGLGELVTVGAPGGVNLNTAPVLVLRALGLADAEIAEVQQARRAAPYTVVPARFAGRGLSVTTRTFRIEADGLVDDRPRARFTAVVQRRVEANRVTVAVLEWSDVQGGV